MFIRAVTVSNLPAYLCSFRLFEGFIPLTKLSSQFFMQLARKQARNRLSSTLTAPCFDLRQLLFADVAKITQRAVFSAPYLIMWVHYGTNTQDSRRQGPIAMF